MNPLDDLLQERLARLEAGEPLETCVAGLLEEEATLLKKAALLRALSEIHPAAEKVAAQRTELLRAARKDMYMTTQNRKPAIRPQIWLAGLAVSAAALFVCVLIASAIAGTTWLRRSSQPSDVAQNPTPQFPWGFITQITEPSLEPANPQTGVLRDARGVVEVQSADGSWKVAKNGEAITAGQRMRTGALSSATLAFYDGSQARLGINSEVSVDTLDAQKSGPRIILMNQENTLIC